MSKGSNKREWDWEPDPRCYKLADYFLAKNANEMGWASEGARHYLAVSIEQCVKETVEWLNRFPDYETKDYRLLKAVDAALRQQEDPES